MLAHDAIRHDSLFMEWAGEAVVLSARPHGETAAIIEVMTAAQGRHLGVVAGGASRRMAPILQPGSQVQLVWRARLEDQIGSFRVEPLRDRAAGLLSDRKALAGLTAVTALLSRSLPERDPHPVLYAASLRLLDALGVAADWPAHYMRWEMQLLEELGFALELTHCAVTGQREGLAFVSPKTGRAVSRAGAGDWVDRLLPLPEALMGQGPASAIDLAAGLAITGHFLTRALAEMAQGQPLPAARQRLVDLLTR